MKTLDRYILVNFMVSVLMCTLITVALRVVADLFVNMDEFSELVSKQGVGWLTAAGYVVSYYGHHCLVYFQEMGGVILLLAALFSLARMNHTNELTAAMAGGLSLYRLMAPVVLVGMGFALVGAVNQELVIPRIKGPLARSRDQAPGHKVLRVELINDAERNIWYSRNFDQGAGQMERPLVLCRDRRGRQQAKVAAERAIECPGEAAWRFYGWSMAILSSSRSRGSLDEGFVLTQRDPAALGGPEGLYDVGDGLKVAYGRRAGRVLLEPRFGVYAPPSGEKQVRLMGTVRCPLAVFESHGHESGYRLLGEPTLLADQVRQWPQFCARLLSGETQGPQMPLGRLWSRLSREQRETLRRSVDEQAAPRPAERRQLLAAMNQAMADDVFVRAGEEAAAGLAPSLAAALSDPAVDPAWRTLALNRAALDRAMKADLIPSAAELMLVSSLTGREVVLRESGKWIDYMSSTELAALIRTGNAPDPAAASLAMHGRFTTPLSWLIMLLLGIPFVVSRERRLKSSALMCLLLVGGFHASIFLSRYMGGDVYQTLASALTAYGAAAPSPAWGPILGAWLPVIIFVPVAVLLLDSMHSMHPADSNDTTAEMLLAPGGRLRRRVFWRWAPATAGAILAAALVDLLWIRHLGLLSATAALLAGWPLLMLHTKRCHDRNRSVLFVLSPLAPMSIAALMIGSTGNLLAMSLPGWLLLCLFAGLSLSMIAWVLIESWLLPGNPGANAFGNDPKEPV